GVFALSTWRITAHELTRTADTTRTLTDRHYYSTIPAVGVQTVDARIEYVYDNYYVLSESAGKGSSSDRCSDGGPIRGRAWWRGRRDPETRPQASDWNRRRATCSQLLRRWAWSALLPGRHSGCSVFAHSRSRRAEASRRRWPATRH